MSVFDKIFAAAEALQAGKSLKNPAKWKKIQLLMTPVLSIVGALFVILDINIDESQLNAISYGIATLGYVLFNTYCTIATSDKVGL